MAVFPMAQALINQLTHRFEFLQCVSGRLERPNVGPEHQWTGDKVQRVSGQGDIYIRPTYPFSAVTTQV